MLDELPLGAIAAGGKNRKRPIAPNPQERELPLAMKMQYRYPKSPCAEGEIIDVAVRMGFERSVLELTWYSSGSSH